MPILSSFSSLLAARVAQGELVFRVKPQALCSFLVFRFWFCFAVKLSVIWSWEKLFLLNERAGRRVEERMKRIMGKGRVLYHLDGSQRADGSDLCLREKCGLRAMFTSSHLCLSMDLPVSSVWDCSAEHLSVLYSEKSFRARLLQLAKPAFPGCTSPRWHAGCGWVSVQWEDWLQTSTNQC